MVKTSIKISKIAKAIELLNAAKELLSEFNDDINPILQDALIYQQVKPILLRVISQNMHQNNEHVSTELSSKIPPHDKVPKRHKRIKTTAGEEEPQQEEQTTIPENQE